LSDAEGKREVNWTVYLLLHECFKIVCFRDGRDTVKYSCCVEVSWYNAESDTLISIKTVKILLGHYHFNLCKESLLS
jgi:hypothetical protein